MFQSVRIRLSLCWLPWAQKARRRAFAKSEREDGLEIGLVMLKPETDNAFAGLGHCFKVELDEKSRSTDGRAPKSQSAWQTDRPTDDDDTP